MTISEDIRALADQGLGVAEVARRLNIRYQHAYNVLKRSKTLAPRRTAEKPVVKTAGRARIEPKPPLSTELETRSYLDSTLPCLATWSGTGCRFTVAPAWS